MLSPSWSTRLKPVAISPRRQSGPNSRTSSLSGAGEGGPSLFAIRG